MSHFCLFSVIFCLFLQFSTLELCYIWFKISLVYPSAYVQSCFPGKIQNQGLSGGIRGCINPILSHFSLFSVIFCLFLQFSTLELCYIWFRISQCICLGLFPCNIQLDSSVVPVRLSQFFVPSSIYFIIYLFIYLLLLLV